MLRMRKRDLNRLTVVITLLLLANFCLLLILLSSHQCPQTGFSSFSNFFRIPKLFGNIFGGGSGSENRSILVLDPETGRSFRYKPDSPLIFIGGFPRSGTTLMRALLDAHPDVRCGQETRLVPAILGQRSKWLGSSKREKVRLIEAGITDDVLDSAVAAFILDIVARHGKPSTVLCNKDPFTMRHAIYLSRQFENAKFIMMLRDGRAVVHSMMKRKVTVTGYNLTDFGGCLKKWNNAVKDMLHQCELVEVHLRALLEFLGLPWSDNLMHHESFIGKEIPLSKTEKSTDQIVKPISPEALTAWAGHVPIDVQKEMRIIAPLLEKLGYDPMANPPDYSRSDEYALENLRKLRSNASLWNSTLERILKS